LVLEHFYKQIITENEMDFAVLKKRIIHSLSLAHIIHSVISLMKKKWSVFTDEI